MAHSRSVPRLDLFRHPGSVACAFETYRPRHLLARKSVSSRKRGLTGETPGTQLPTARPCYAFGALFRVRSPLPVEPNAALTDRGSHDDRTRSGLLDT